MLYVITIMLLLGGGGLGMGVEIIAETETVLGGGGYCNQVYPVSQTKVLSIYSFLNIGKIKVKYANFTY